MRCGRRPSVQQGDTPRDLDLEPFDLLARLGETVVQVSPAGGELERRYDFAQSGQLEPEQLLIPAGGIALERGEASKIRLPIECVLDRVSGGVVLGGDPGTPTFDRERKEREPSPVMGAKVVERADELLEQ